LTSGSGVEFNHPNFEKKGAVVASYIVLINWTEQGVKGYKDSASRVDAFNARAAQLGGSLKEIYWTLGPHDVVAVVEAPDDETMTAAMLELGAGGNVRTTTMRAFTRSEFEAIVQKTA